jgi:photosystem II stability/assembly factor-like uncharacterized protein
MKKSFLTFILVLAVYLIQAQPANFKAHGLGGGGSFYCPSINPNNNNEMFETTDMTDLYHSLDGGNSWSVVNFNSFVADGKVSKVQFTSTANRLYSLSMNNISEVDVPVVSTDDGSTWAPLTTDPSGGNGVYYVIANPLNPNQVIVSDYGNLYLSNNGGSTFGTAFYTDTTGNGAYVAGTFFDGSTIYICTQEGLIVSTNSGASWSKPAKPGIVSEDILSFAGAKSGSTTRFFCITQSLGNIYVPMDPEDGSTYANVYSLDYGGSWVKKITGIVSGDWPFFIRMSNGNINLAYIGGSSGNTGTPIVLKTSNAGTTWNYIFNTTNNQNIQTGYCGYDGDFSWQWAQYCFGLDVCASDSNTVLITDEGFSHKTNDGGKTWQAVYVPAANLNPVDQPTPTGLFYPSNGLENTSSWQMMWYDSLHTYAGFSDVTAIRSKDGGNTWGHGISLPGSYNAVYYFLKNPANGVLYAAISGVHDIYESTYLEDSHIDDKGGAVLFSTDTGKTFQILKDFETPVIWLALDPTDGNRMYASVINDSSTKCSAGGIWMTNNIQNNASATWTKCANPPRTEGHPLDIRVLNDGTLVTSYSGRRNTKGNFTNTSGVFMSTNQGSSWTDVSNPGMDYWTMDVVIDPNDATQDTWFGCVFSGWGGPANGQGGLYRTTNRGTSWTKLVNTTNQNVGNLSSIFSITFDPVNKGAAYMTAQPGGIYYTTDAEATTPVFTQLQQYPFENPSRIYFNPYNANDIWVSSFGNGLEMGSLSVNTGITQTTNNQSALRVYPNPFSESTNVDLSGLKGGGCTIDIYDMMGQLVKEITNVNESSYTLSRDNMPEGVYMLKVVNRQNKCAVKRIVID